MPKTIVCIGGIEHGRYWPSDVEWIETPVDGDSGVFEMHVYRKQTFDGVHGPRDAFVLKGLSLAEIVKFLGDTEFQRLIYRHGSRPKRDVVSPAEFVRRFPFRAEKVAHA